MKRKGYYFFSVFFIIICIFFATEALAKTEYVNQGKYVGTMIDIWSKAISERINKVPISMYIDGIDTKASKGKVYMDDTMTLMVPSDLLTEAFDCAVNVYKEKQLVIEKGNTTLKINIDEKILFINGAEFRIAVAPVKKGEIIYVPLTVIIRGFGYTYSWDMAENRATLINDNPEFKILPYSYCYVGKERNSVVKNQGVRSTCWAFAALTALETTLLPEEQYIFSVDHMSINNSFNASQFDGGEYSMALAYLTAWQGPVLEKDDPYGDRVSDSSLLPVVHVQEAQIIAPKNFDKIKEMVYKYGGVQSSLYTSMTNAAGTSKYYNKEKAAYCYIGEEKPNHDVVIIGWDDNYPKENFNANIESNGAFICQSSWGEDFGEKGVFYVSYMDANIGIRNIVYTGVEKVDNYDRIYQTDLCGWQGILGYENNYGYFANVYESESPEKIRAVGFYATDVETAYTVYVVENFESQESFANMRYVTSGVFENAGYYTVRFDEPVLITSDKYAVVVRIDTPNSKRPIAVEMQKDYATKTVDISDGEGYISLYGQNWERVEEKYNCNVCLKAYTDVYEFENIVKDE
ncbi:MAG: cell surface protein [Lachnospiraceae bacterium]|nr:cell surface protein [Lachnospiraceae bacterium]